MLKLTDYIGLGNAEYSDTLIGLRLSTRLHIGGKAGPSYIDVLLSGVSPLALTNALELNYIKALGATEQNGTPTPSNPVDIVCNNGVLKVKNLFDKSIFANDTDQNLTYTAYQVPNGEYTMSSPDFPFNSSATNVFFLAGNVITGASSSSNGVAQDKPITITVTDGYYTVAHRYRSNSNNNHPIDFNWQIEQGSTATSYIPYGQVYADGTQETVTVANTNLFDKNTVVSGYRLTNVTNKRYGNSVDYTTAADCFYSALIPVEVGKTYYKNAPTEDAYHRFKIYNSNQVSVRIEDTNTVTIQSGESYIAFCGYLTELDSTILSDSAINVTTANAEMLLKVGNNQDNQELLTGNITRNVSVKVFNGTENWTKNQSLNIFILDIPEKRTGKVSTLCSHYVYSTDSQAQISDKNYGQTKDSKNVFIRDDDYTTVNAWKQFLAEQYANGTPVIFVYPLSTSTTETVTGQTLTASGNCTVTATGSLNNLELELSYKQGVTVRVRETSNENLDNQVNVTIS